MDGADRFEEVLASHGIDDPGVIASTRERFIEDRYRGLRLFAESLEVIAAVKRVADIGLITNGPTAIQRPKIDLLAIGHLFPVLIVSEEAGVWKPDPAIFQLALDAAGVAPHEAIYVGDSPHHDVPGARAAGLTAVWMNRAGVEWPGEAPPDVEIRDLYELLPLIGLERPA
jgi:putative hydrolase of the HAD superfamily